MIELGANWAVVESFWSREVAVTMVLDMCTANQPDETHIDQASRPVNDSDISTRKPAGFWIRLAATMIDALVVCACVLMAIRLAERAGVYLPLELSVVLVGTCYSVVLLGWKGRTVGKALCGVTVQGRLDDPIGFLRAVARETFGKLVSLAGLFVGFLWIAVSPQNKAWHDRICGTMAVQDVRAAHRARVILTTVLLVVGLGAGLCIHNLLQVYLLVSSMASSVGAADYAKRAPSALTEVRDLSSEDQAGFATWIDRSGRAPLAYAVAKSAEHQVVIFGEMHERREALRFLNELIPLVYEQANVRCVAMEVCLAEDNSTIEHLVNAPEYDRDLAMTIARHQPFGLWGWKGYWDVLESVWRLNQTIPDREKRIRVIGLDRRMDMQSIAMVGFEDNAARDCPIWEKLRIYRALRTVPLVLARDAFMASQIEKEIIAKGQRGIVWVGRNHSLINSPGYGPAGRLPRMGFLLRQQYGDKIFQIRLHDMDIPAALVDRSYEGPDASMADFLESVMRLRDNKCVGFDVAPSPVALIRDGGSFEFYFDERLGFVDVAAGYVFLAPWRDLTTCEWLEGYISRGMFVRNKPFYQAFGHRAGKVIRSADDANGLFAHMDD